MRSTDNDEEIKPWQEEQGTLKTFIENQGATFLSDEVVYDRGELREPADLSYLGVDYQITYGDDANLADMRRSISNTGRYFEVRKISQEDYASRLLTNALERKKNKSDTRMTLLVDCTYTAYDSLESRKKLCSNYFSGAEKDLGGDWEHIYVVFSDGNVQLR